MCGSWIVQKSQLPPPVLFTALHYFFRWGCGPVKSTASFFLTAGICCVCSISYYLRAIKWNPNPRQRWSWHAPPLNVLTVQSTFFGRKHLLTFPGEALTLPSFLEKESGGRIPHVHRKALPFSRLILFQDVHCRYCFPSARVILDFSRLAEHGAV